MRTSKTEHSGVWVSHPTGNANVRGVIDGLMGKGILDSFHTCIGIGRDCNNPLTNKLFEQRHYELPEAMIRSMPWRESLRLLTGKLGWFPSLREHEVGPLCVDQIYQRLDTVVAKRLHMAEKKPTALYAYEDGALASFKAAHAFGISTIYDLPIGYWRTARRIQSEEAERQPDWAMTMQALLDSDEKVARKDEELQSADTIFVASQFTADTLKDAPFELPPTKIIPYGCPPALTSALPPQSKSAKLKVLYVGGLSQRKGLSYLLDAVTQSGVPIELTLVGKRIADCAPLDAALKQHHWIESLPHDQILAVMREHDVFVFPSLFEGFGLVLTEALSQGLPIISTTHTCAPDIIQDGREGFIVPIRDSDAIAEKLTLLSEDRNRLQEMKNAALENARKRTWKTYEQQLALEVSRIININCG
jgi:glycosyltransferase involved in cell wall biosynthesis